MEDWCGSQAEGEEGSEGSVEKFLFLVEFYPLITASRKPDSSSPGPPVPVAAEDPTAVGFNPKSVIDHPLGAAVSRSG